MAWGLHILLPTKRARQEASGKAQESLKVDL